MNLIILFLSLITLAVSTALPTPDPDITLLPRQDDNAKGCGLATNSDVTLSYSLVGDAYCRDLHANGDDVKTYNVAEGCICLFYANDKCNKKPVEEWTGWVFGPAQGEFTKKGTSHYLCGEGSNPFKPPRV